MTRQTTATKAAYERGYRQGYVEARADLVKLYGDRIREAVAILTAQLPLQQANDSIRPPSRFRCLQS